MSRTKAGIVSTIILLLAVAVIAMTFGKDWFGRDGEPGRTTESASATGQTGGDGTINGVVQDDSGREVLYWHDPMVPQHRFDEPGQSPFMDMKLVPKYADTVAEGGISVSPQTRQNLGIRTAPAVQESYTDTVRAVGEIQPNERAIEMVHNRVAGFIEKLLVRAEGDPVRKGEKLAEVYAPELLAAQEELLALSKLQGLEGLAQIRQAAHSRLRLLGMTAEEIQRLEHSGKTSDRIGIYAPSEGIVQKLGIREGSTVQPGDTLFEIVDLSTVWLSLEVPERQLGRVEGAERVDVIVPAYPDRSFDGTVDYIYPSVNTSTRTVPVRVVLDNESGRLKPGMYAEASIVAGEYKAVWVPSEAVIQTGERSLVMLQVDDSFSPAIVKTGQQRGEQTEILEGVKAGERVVVSGQFLLDSEASLSGMLAKLESGGEEATESPAKSAGSFEQAADALHRGRGTVEAYDMGSGLVTLTHEPIPSLQWPAMTMPFKLRDPHALHGVEPDAQVTFTMKGEPEGDDYVIEEITLVEDDS